MCPSCHHINLKLRLSGFTHPSDSVSKFDDFCIVLVFHKLIAKSSKFEIIKHECFGFDCEEFQPIVW